MTLRLALRSLAAQPVRSIVLACGFGTGIGAMAGLLGVGEVILEQSRAPALRGGGDLVIEGASGDVRNARFVLSHVLGAPPLEGQVRVAAPAVVERLYLLGDEGETLPVFARGGIPGLERRLGDPETAQVESWRDTPADRTWMAPEAGQVLRAMDRFHPIPDLPARSESWAEWLYFNGRAADARFYLTFFVGPETSPGRRRAGVRLQLERAGRVQSFSATDDVSSAEVLASAPDLAIGGSRVSLEGLRYRIDLALEAETTALPLEGRLTLDAMPGRSMPPFQVRGAGGWVSGYVVPVLSGELSGTLNVGAARVDFEGGVGYHDHNWGFWDGVTWRWGQVANEEISLVWGRIIPPRDAADPERLPGLLVALGPDGPLAYTTNVHVEETDAAGAEPRRLIVRGRGPSLDLTLDLAVDDVVRTRLEGSALGGGRPPTDFLQLRGRYRVSGRLGDGPLEFTAAGAAETFRGAPTVR